MHRGSDLFFQQILDLVLACRVEIAGNVGDQRQPWRGDVHPVEHLAQRRAGRGDDAGVEGVTDRQLHGLVAALLEELDGRFDGFAFAADDGLTGAVDVGRNDIAVDLLKRRLDDLEGSQHGGHPAVVVHLDLGHFAPAPGGRFQRLGEGQDARRYQRAILAQRVAHDHIRLKAIVGQQAADGLVESQHGWLGDLRLHQVEVGLTDGGLVVGIDKQIGGQRLAQDGLHDGVGLIERGLHRGGDGRQLATHINVLAALTREEESQLAGFGASAAEDALGFHRFPGLRCVEAHHLARFLQAIE